LTLSKISYKMLILKIVILTLSKISYKMLILKEEKHNIIYINI